MREKINRFAKGIFLFDRPDLSISVDRINLIVPKGEKAEGSFSVSAGDKKFKGIVFSSQSLFYFDNPSFCGVNNTVHYKFDATNLDVGDRFEFSITVVTEYGEVSIPVTCKVTSVSFNTSIGPVSDVFQFANLAQTNWGEAKLLFKSPYFYDVFSSQEKENELMIRALRGSGNVSLAVEELLIALRKKRVITVTADRMKIDLESPDSPTIDEGIVLSKDTWGYVQLTCEAEGDFIVPSTGIIWAEDFKDNSYRLSYSIDKSKLSAGMNPGKIIISSVRQKIVIDVVCHNEVGQNRSRSVKRRIKHDILTITQTYIDYRFGKISAGKFAGEIESVLDGLKPLREETIKEELFHIYAGVISGKSMKVENRLKNVIDSDDWRDNEPIVFAGVLFLEGLIHPEKQTSNLEYIRQLFDRTGDAYVYIMSMMLDDRKRISPQRNYEALKECCANQSPSIAALCEAALIVSRQPEVIRELSGFDIKVLSLALKNGLLQKKSMITIALLASRNKKADFRTINLFYDLYKEFGGRELLEALCQLLISSGERSARAFDILAKGCEEHVNITNIFEACALAVSGSGDVPVPGVVLSYFEKGISLPSDRKAALFANIVRNRDRMSGISPMFSMMIREFTVNGLSEGIISDDFAILYNNLQGVDTLNESQAARLPELIFKNKLTVDLPDARKVIVVYGKLKKEEQYDLFDKSALIDVYSDDCLILFEDDRQNRILNCEYRLEKLITNQELIDYSMETQADDKYVTLNICENLKTIESIKRCYGMEEISESFRRDCTKRLIGYYYENLEGEIMESYLVGLDLSKYSRKERCSFIELMMQRELYSLAFKNIELYGYYGLDVKRLTKLVTKLVDSEKTLTENRLLTDICSYVFSKGRTEKNVILVLTKFYNGDAETSYHIWQRAMDFGIDASELEERLLGQLLFTESDMNYARTVFKHYYGHQSYRGLVKAFISYYAYGCLVYDRLPDDEMLDMMIKECRSEYNKVCALVLLKCYSKRKEFTEVEKHFIETELERMERENVRFAFLKDFPDTINVPGSFRDKYFVEYHTDCNKQVTIHYRMKTDRLDEYIEEKMQEADYGIFVKEFIVFCGEVIQYYISEEDENGHTITEASCISVEADVTDQGRSRYEQLNWIITSKQVADNVTMKNMLEEYVRTEYLSKKLFDPIVD